MKFFIVALFCFVIIDTMAFPLGDKASSDDDHVMVSVSKKVVFHLVVQFLVALQKNVQDYVQCTDGQILSLPTVTDRWQLFKSLWTIKCAGHNLDLEDL
uniref:Uncharacterized protein n=1 Tax=Acrobeloides nanus TaxID=290746 RepID=A0A914D3L0_9BILA